MRGYQEKPKFLLLRQKLVLNLTGAARWGSEEPSGSGYRSLLQHHLQITRNWSFHLLSAAESDGSKADSQQEEWRCELTI